MSESFKFPILSVLHLSQVKLHFRPKIGVQERVSKAAAVLPELSAEDLKLIEKGRSDRDTMAEVTITIFTTAQFR